MIEVEDGVEDQKVTALRLAAPERVVGEQHDMPLIERHVNHCGVLSKIAAAVKQTGYEQVFGVAVA